MVDTEKDYYFRLDELRRRIKSPRNFQSAIELALEIHAITHTGEVSSSTSPTYCDELLAGLEDGDYSVMPAKKDETIAWHLWHIARIEDLVGNLLIAEKPQIFNDEWMNRMNISVKDTGNAMTDDEIISLSEQVNKRELINYRNAVGRRTRELLKSLTPDDLKRKPADESLERLVGEGGLLEVKQSIWLKNLWGSYTVTGLILLPLTRHHMIHLPDSVRIKEFIIKSRCKTL